MKWAYQMDSRAEVSPIVVDGVMYVTGPNTAAALDVRTGRELWTWKRPIPKDYQNIGFGRVNRGPAILDDQIFVATLDCYLVALDAKSGLERWSSKVEDYKPGYSMTLAPLAIRDKVLVGVSGGETGIRGFVDAYDAKTGSRAWRFYTIPGPGEPGNDTWPGDSWKTGGGSTWVTGSYDPETNLVYWGIGNPGPDWNPDSRRGDNLYTCSLVALDGDTGKLKWHFQFTPNDSHDWDSTHVPVLFEADVRGTRRKLVAVANRNAFYYVLDRSSGEFIAGRPYAKQTWAKGLDDRGRPIVNPGHRAQRGGHAGVAQSERRDGVVQPVVQSGGGPALRRGARDRVDLLQAQSGVQAGHVFRRRRRSAARRAERRPAPSARSKPPPGRCAGSSRCTPRRGPACCRPPAAWSSPAPTRATSSRSTRRPASRCGISKPAARIAANPISFNIDGKQCIAIAAGRVLYVFSL